MLYSPASDAYSSSPSCVCATRSEPTLTDMNELSYPVSRFVSSPPLYTEESVRNAGRATSRGRMVNATASEDVAP